MQVESFVHQKPPQIIYSPWDGIDFPSSVNFAAGGFFEWTFKKAFVMFDLGLSTGFLINQTNEKHTDLHFSNTSKDEQAINETRSFETGLLLGIGGGYQKFSLEVRYEIGNGMSPYLDLSSKVKRIYALLAYRF